MGQKITQCVNIYFKYVVVVEEESSDSDEEVHSRETATSRKVFHHIYYSNGKVDSAH